MADLPALDGPRTKPLNGGAPKQIVVLVHGYGANGADLIGLAPALQSAAPDALFAAPDAPEPVPGHPAGRQWFPLTDFNAEERRAGTAKAGPVLDAYLDTLLAEHGLSEKDLMLIGFSQGTMLSLHVALRRAEPAAGVVGFSGMLIGAETLADDIVSRPPVALVHGDADEILPVQCTAEAYQALRENGVSVTAHVRPGLGHGIDDAGAAIAAAMLAGAFGGR
ncbi:MAG: alpha/beta hydrolase [Rhodospirillales bacterium]